MMRHGTVHSYIHRLCHPLTTFGVPARLLYIPGVPRLRRCTPVYSIPPLRGSYSPRNLLVCGKEGVEFIEHAALGGAGALAVAQEFAA